MNPLDDPTHRLIEDTQRRINGFDATAERYAREFEHADRLRRAVEPFPAILQEIAHTEHVLREIEPFRAIQAQVESAVAQQMAALDAQEQMARSIQASVVAAEAAQATFINSLIASHEGLARLATGIEAQIAQEMTQHAAIAQMVGGFAERVVREAEFRDALVGNLVASYSASAAGEATITANFDDLFSTLITGFTETGLAEAEVSHTTALWRFDAWLETLPPNVKKIIVGVLIWLVTVILSSAVDSCKTAYHAHAASPRKLPPPKLEANESDMCR